MKSFISNVIKDVLSKQQFVSEVTFVLPSQRACVFLKQELLQCLTTTSFIPKIISIENFIQELADIQLIDNTQLLFEFYSIYLKKLPIEHRESFESFTEWATIALSDFNEIDSYLVNAAQFFQNLNDVKKLDEWFKDKEPSKLATSYLQFFEKLNVLYNSLYELLKSNKFGYQGLIYREATENIEYYIENNTNDVAFVGFNALNKAEEYIFQELLNSGLATVYWDANDSFLDAENEAGSFLRRYKKDWSFYKENPFLWSDFSKNEKQNIQIIGAPKNVSQIKYAGELLGEMNVFNKTALVLADENLLGLTLNSLPPNVQKINITMGYPLKEMPIASLFDKLFKLHLNQQKFDKVAQKQFYFKDVLNLLADPFINKLFGANIQAIISTIKKENAIFINADNLKLASANESEKTVFKSMFQFSSNVNGIIQECCNLIEELREYVVGVEKEYLYRFFNIFQQLKTLNLKYKHLTSLNALTLFYQQLLQNENLSFQGEPLEGLQLMGMLETRGLDFETVIVTSLNEGILPAGKSDYSFIPFDVKKYFGLPTYQEKDAIFSYHFQRLIFRAKNVYLIYNTETDGYGSGEKSRFLTRLEIQNPELKPTIVSPYVQKSETSLLEIHKNKAVLERLKEVFEKGISPSALSTYIYNPISFYEQKVLKIRDTDEVEETIAVNTMGTVIHDVLYSMYKPFVNKILSSDNVKEMLKKTEDLLNFYFEKHYVKGNIHSGKNKLIYEVSKSYIDKFLKQEIHLLKQNKELKIIALEQPLSASLEIEDLDFPVKIHGIVDRVDELDGVTRIIDYKTGMVSASQLKMANFSQVSEDYKYTKALQVMLYSYLFVKNNAFPVALESGIISFKNLKSGFLKMNFSEKYRGTDNSVTEERINEFMVEVKQIIKEIVNTNIPFKENEDLAF